MAETADSSIISVSDESNADSTRSTRDGSPTPSLTPSRAIDAVPNYDRSVSTPSTSTSSSLATSDRSRASRLSDAGSVSSKRRGYMRPLGTAFADSARNRDSVMNLGTISHLQYYFSRTGLLDGKGGQLAKESERLRSINGRENADPNFVTSDELALASFAWLDGSTSNYAISDPGQDGSFVESPCDIPEGHPAWGLPADHPMIPPTMSTYKQKMTYIEPLPDLPVLRRELKEALQDACKMLEESQKDHGSQPTNDGETNGFFEIQGLHQLDIITLAIRAAKNYYTAHSDPQKLYEIRSEKVLRSDLYQVLDILKRMASRNFRGGMRLTELTGIIIWIESIDKLLKKEELGEQLEAQEKNSWIWREGDWTGREREREWLFLKSFDKSATPLPRWEEAHESSSIPNSFLEALQDGQRLIKLHNVLIAKSKRKFGAIKTWHADVAKPYRMTENLRFWIKASELRWEIPLIVPVSDVVNNKDEAAWKAFDQAVFRWARGVRAELMEEWRIEAQISEKRRPPEVKVDTPSPERKTNARKLTEPIVVDLVSATTIANDPASQPRADSVDPLGSTSESDAETFSKMASVTEAPHPTGVVTLP